MELLKWKRFKILSLRLIKLKLNMNSINKSPYSSETSNDDSIYNKSSRVYNAIERLYSQFADYYKNLLFTNIQHK